MMKFIVFGCFLAISSAQHEGATSYVSTSFGGQNKVQHISNPSYTQANYEKSYISVPQYIQKYTPQVVAKVPVTYQKEYQGEEYGPAQYEFQYSVEDKHTGDIKSQHEVRNGDAVQGEYSLHEADGTIRTVKYTADKHSGFNAVVERTGNAAHPEVAPVKAVQSVPVVYDYYKH